MEQKLPLITKKIWRLMRVMFFMLKKGIIKRKFLVQMTMKRGKIAGKALQNLMFHHHNNWADSSYPIRLEEYEFSCNNTPSYPLSILSTHKKHQRNRHNLATSNPPLVVDHCDDIVINSAVLKALDMLTSGKSPMVEQHRTMDSLFPVTNYGEDDQVDDAAERFIRRFYNDRIREN